MKRLYSFLAAMAALSTLSASSIEDCQKSFENIYEKGLWGFNREGIGFSGSGSNPQFITPYICYLNTFLTEKKIESMVDVGCGDWSFTRHIPLKNIKYTGIDVVRSVIERNRQQFSSENIEFVCGNATLLDLPKADLLVCKEVLQHLSNEDVAKFLKKIACYKYCIITDDVYANSKTSNNPDIQSGTYRPLDLTAPPFNLKAEKVLTYFVGGDMKQVLLINNSTNP